MTHVAKCRGLPWRTFSVAWLVLGLLVFVPSFQDGWLYNACPVGLGYVGLLLGDERVVSRLLPWFVVHALSALAATVGIVAVRRRLARPQLVRGAAAVAGLLLCLIAWAVHECWPDGVYFDAHTTYYDVGDALQSAPAKVAGITGAADLAVYLFAQGAQRSDHWLPQYIGTIKGTNTLIAWGTWPEHRRLRKELEAFGDS